MRLHKHEQTARPVSPARVCDACQGRNRRRGRARSALGLTLMVRGVFAKSRKPWSNSRQSAFSHRFLPRIARSGASLAHASGWDNPRQNDNLRQNIDCQQSRKARHTRSHRPHEPEIRQRFSEPVRFAPFWRFFSGSSFS